MLFVYTDGVTEAANSDNELFGEERMLTVLNKNTGKSPQEIVESVREEIFAFTGEAEQFDDITMLCFKYNG